MQKNQIYLNPQNHNIMPLEPYSPSDNEIRRTLNLIKEYIGLDLELCDYFTGIRDHNGRKYFNVILDHNLCESQEYVKLVKFASQYNLIQIAPNGVQRVAIYIPHKNTISCH